ncbi:hypothetical protein [Sphingomonas sp. UYEF23]|uniref:hypothetical protein n=1 Tax=Sphingomonas sp. UYEF23 TaxID=1756408 RepID=UPI0033964AB2
MAWSIADYRTQYAKADSLCQEVQSFKNAAGIPAINELRNAGHHFLKAIDDTGGLASQAELDAAVAHARRAIYEATEAGIVSALAAVRKFRNDYATVQVSGVIPDYVKRLTSCSAAKRLIENNREDTFDRAQDHADRVTVFRDLRTFVDDLDNGRDDVNKVVADDRKQTRRFTTQIVMGVLAIIITICFGIWASTGYKGFTPSSGSSNLSSPVNSADAG